MAPEKKIDDRIIINIKITGDGKGKTRILKKIRSLLEGEEGYNVIILLDESELRATRNGYHPEEHNHVTNPIKEFIKAYIRPDPEGIMTKETLYRLYYKWCISIIDSPPLGESAFARSFKQQAILDLPNMRESRRNIDGKRARCWDGIIDKTDN